MSQEENVFGDLFQDAEGENTKGFTPLNPGESIPVNLVTVTVDDTTGNLSFDFKGTYKGDTAKGITPNTGQFRKTFWANNFDSKDEKYNIESVKRQMGQIKHIIGAFFSEEEVESLRPTNFADFTNKILKLFKTKNVSTTPAFIKVVLNNKNKPEFPMFPDFISTDLKPKSLKLNLKINPKTNLPYDRITPIDLDVASADNSSGDELPFKEDEAPAPAFTAMPDDECPI